MDAALEPVLTVADVRAVEKSAHGAPLMERAGSAAAGVATALLAARSGTVVVLAGPGNNGGDGFVVARRLRDAFHDVAVVFRDDAKKLPPDAAHARAAWLAAGGVTVSDPPRATPALVVDALFGIGIARPLATRHAELVAWANACGAPIVALDVPTGLNADSGIATAPAIRARASATFIALKPGMLTAAGPDLCGEISVHPLDLAIDASAAHGHCLRWRALADVLPEILYRRARNAHKGSFGTLLVVGGADGMCGAPLLAARAALRLGAGKVIVGFAAAAHPAVDLHCPELMLRAAQAPFDGADAIVIGPGLGTSAAARGLVAAAIAASVPLVLDADALNLVAADAELRAALRSRHAPRVMTPHPAEAARLRATDVSDIQRDRCAAARAIAHEFGAHVVVKGGGSVLAHPDGRYDINASGNPALATAGTGDVLSGMIGALVAQRIDAADALRLGVCLHGAAADALVARGTGPLGVAASSIAEVARDLVNAATASLRR
ncbi:MAG TPA: NAD(P)H-hydrate dehydratase [Casimicrobiaceae bacterium]|nr:NAD(P)H-hydrate dehydratase [Casimicrobiaceae bacterium]